MSDSLLNRRVVDELEGLRLYGEFMPPAVVCSIYEGLIKQLVHSYFVYRYEHCFPGKKWTYNKSAVPDLLLGCELKKDEQL